MLMLRVSARVSELETHCSSAQNTARIALHLLDNLSPEERSVQIKRRARKAEEKR